LRGNASWAERRAGRNRRLFFGRDRTREVDFVVDYGQGLDLLEAKWTELPAWGDTGNPEFLRRTLRRPKVPGAAIVCRAPHGFPLADGLRALPASELG
jgi:hypothetical protein